MKNKTILSTIFVLAMSATSAIANTQWIEDRLSDQCSDESRRYVADATRRSIEESVARAEASIRPPTSVTVLSCVDNLLDFDFPWPPSFDFALPNFNELICGVIEDKYAEVTQGLTGSMDELTSGINSQLPSFSDEYGLVNLRAKTGNTKLLDINTDDVIKREDQPRISIPGQGTTTTIQLQQLHDNIINK